MSFARFSILPAAFLVILAGCGNENPGIPVTLKDHRFTPAEIHVPANQPVLLSLANEDDAAEEFDIEIPDEEAEKISTVGDAVKYIDEKTTA